MKSLFNFLLLLFIILSPGLAAAQNVTVSFSDLNLVSRQIEVYEITNDNATIYELGNTGNSSLSLDPTKNYHFVLKPSPLTYFDDPRSVFDYLFNSAMGQTVSFILLLVVIIGPVRWIY